MAGSKRLVFPDDDDGRELFRYLYDGVILGASRGQTKTKAEVRLEASLQRHLRTISVPAVGYDPGTRPATARDLSPGPQTLDLPVAELELVDKLVQAVPWGVAQSIPVADLYDFLGKAMLAPDAPSEEA